ncbi:unnamed protein product [Albugo candida]|uniref:Secreted protein n=1 Tax=Albugo candida TaxID=65357 RepID=A0A024FYM0_9STRA|nr:unnamed protein product [Albugo candida]|eukprot:CCI39368.1 unnamed protein product [Albugo candida]
MAVSSLYLLVVQAPVIVHSDFPPSCKAIPHATFPTLRDMSFQRYVYVLSNTNIDLKIQTKRIGHRFFVHYIQHEFTRSKQTLTVHVFLLCDNWNLTQRNKILHK